MFEKYLEQILKIFQYVDIVLIADDKGIIRYYYTNKSERTRLHSDAIVGKHITDVYISVVEEESTIMQVLKTGKPAINRIHRFATPEGLVIQSITSDIPIVENDRIIGVIDISSYDRQTSFISADAVKNEKELYTISDIVTVSSQMIELKEKIEKIANTDSSVMIYGETGTGKELVAQSIHSSGKRRKKPFISQNCSAIPSTLLESFLFGTTKGSFTGAEDRKGLFEMADGGTLFLDEINSMEFSMQSKLLKAIEEKQFTRVGGSKPIHVDVKIVSATNEKVEDCLAKQSVRADLLYRLSVVRLNILPLRERMIDIVPLTRSFINEFNIRMKRDVIDVKEEVYDAFSKYDWPGNVRELRSAIECAFNITNDRFIGKNDLPEYIFSAIKAKDTKYSIDYNLSLKDMVENYEKHIIKKTLANSADKVEAAAKLKTTKQVLNYKMNKYNLK